MGARFKIRSVLTGMAAGQAMQRAFPRTTPDRGLDEVIRQMVRTREDAVLVEGEDGAGEDRSGVVTKTDLTAAFYGGLAIDTRAGDLVAGPVETCPAAEGLDRVLDRMNAKKIHQIFVADEEGAVCGKISHEDVAGLIYRHCRRCRQGHRARSDRELPRLTVAEVMTRQIQACRPSHTLYQVMDMLSHRQVRALPVVDENHCALGVISKTDLIRAYSRGREPWEPAGEIMASPVVTAGPEDLLSAALTTMLLRDIQHLFVAGEKNGRVVGSVSLSDAARFRSGTCRACSPSRNF